MLSRVAVSTANLLVIVLLGGCSHAGTSAEDSASVCVDGLDNDGDGQTDCADPDCKSLSFCAAIDASTPLDSRVQPDVPRRDQLLSDATTQHDQRLLDVTRPHDQGSGDTAAISSYGTRCNGTTHYLDSCPDGKTVCVPGSLPSKGFCTYSCQPSRTCPAGPKGEHTICDVFIDEYLREKYYCRFTCTLSGSDKCPSTLECRRDPLGDYFCE